MLASGKDGIPRRGGQVFLVSRFCAVGGLSGFRET
jgi:hypothetical protein